MTGLQSEHGSKSRESFEKWEMGLIVEHGRQHGTPSTARRGRKRATCGGSMVSEKHQRGRIGGWCRFQGRVAQSGHNGDEKTD